MCIRDSDEGLRKLEEALALYREVGDKAGEGNILWALGSYNYFTAAAAPAEHWYRAARKLQAKSGTMLANEEEETYTTYNAPSPKSVLSPEDFDRYVAEGAS